MRELSFLDMKFLLVASLLLALFLGAPLAGEDLRVGRVEVELANELGSLAQGYAAAFAAMPAGAKYVAVRTDEGPRYLEGSVSSLEAFEGALLIRIERGPVVVVSARDVLRLSNTRGY